jgi:transcriptional regulator with XRE-family HTH domain
MATEPRQIPVTPSPDAARRRLNIHGIKEMPAGYDAEVAELFRDLRAASNLSETDLAARLGTRMEVVQALEQGALFALPPWPETCRVVNGYGMLLHLDVRPLLRRIYAQLEAGIVELQRPKAMPDVPVMDVPQQPMAPPGAPQGYPQPQAWPGHAAPHPHSQPQQQHYPPPPQPQPQAPWPGAPQAAPYPQARPAQHQQHQPPPRQQMQPPPPPAPPPQMVEPSLAAPEPEVKKPRGKGGALLKWALGLLILSAVGAGLWFTLSNAPIPGTSGSSGPVLDPDDPRSRKTDRLPSAF